MNKTFFTTPAENLPQEGQEIIFVLKNSIPVLSGYENQNEISGIYKFGIFLTKESKSDRAVLNGIDTFLWMNETGLVTFPSESVEKWIGKEIISYSDEIGSIIAPSGVSMFSDTEDSEEKELKKIKVDQVKKRSLKFYLLIVLKILNSFFSIPVNLTLVIIYFIRFFFLVLPKKINSVIKIKKAKKDKIKLQEYYNKELENLEFLKIAKTGMFLASISEKEKVDIDISTKGEMLKEICKDINEFDVFIQENRKGLNLINLITSYYYKTEWARKKSFEALFFLINLLFWIWCFDLINYLSVLN